MTAGRADHAAVAGDARGEIENGCSIGRGQCALPQHDHRTLGVLQHLGEGVRAVGDGGHTEMSVPNCSTG